jgi:hypothetical protein
MIVIIQNYFAGERSPGTGASIAFAGGTTE